MDEALQLLFFFFFFFLFFFLASSNHDGWDLSILIFHSSLLTSFSPLPLSVHEKQNEEVLD